MIKALAALGAVALLASSATAQTPGQTPAKQDEAAFRGLYKELVETRTAYPDGDCTLAATRMAARLKVGSGAFRSRCFFQ